MQDQISFDKYSLSELQIVPKCLHVTLVILWMNASIIYLKIKQGLDNCLSNQTETTFILLYLIGSYLIMLLGLLSRKATLEYTYLVKFWYIYMQVIS